MTPFWFEKISILFDKRYLLEIIPKKEFDLSRKLNALLRFTIYYCSIVFLLDMKKKQMLYFILGMAIFTYIIHKKYNDAFIEKVTNKLMNDSHDININELKETCRIPDKDNPFMNPLLTDYGTNKSKPACDFLIIKVFKIIRDNFDEDLYKDVNDILNKNNSQRQFFLFQEILFQMIRIHL